VDSAGIVQRAADDRLPLAEDTFALLSTGVGVNHRCPHVPSVPSAPSATLRTGRLRTSFVSEESLHEADVVAAFEQVDSKGVAQGPGNDAVRQHRHSIPSSFAITHDDLAAWQVHRIHSISLSPLP